MMLLALLLAMAPPACGDAATQLAMDECEGARAARADAALNAAWKRLIAQNRAVGAEFVASERLWLQFRDAECKARGDRYRGGSIQPAIVAGCRADLTEARTKDIDLIVKDQH